VLKKRVFQKIFKIAEVSNLTKEEKAMYDSNLKSKWDYENSIAFAREEAAEEATEKAEHNTALNIARKMKEKGVPAVEIAMFTDLCIEEIEKL
jgi:predicted transposase/invertase (TIGR01784 family)